MFALRASQLIGSLQRNTKVNILRPFSAQPNQQHGALPPSDSITASWSFKLDLGDDAKDSKISVTNIINELIREWLGPRKKKERLRFYHSVRTRSSGREVDKDGFLFKPGERLSVPGYLVRGIIYELSSLSLGDGNLDRLVEKGVVPKELLPPPPNVEPETLGLEDLLASQAGGSRVGSTTRLTDGREGGGIVSQSNPLDAQSQGLGVLSTQALGLKEVGKGGGGARESSPLKQETEADLVGLLEGRRLSGSQASTSVESGFSRGGDVATAKVLDMAAALDTIKGVARTDEFSLPSETGPRNKRTLTDSSSSMGGLAWPDGSRHQKEDAKGTEYVATETPNPAVESAPSSTWLTTALEEAKPAQKAAPKAEVELDKRIRNKYEGKLRSIREKAAARKQEGQVSDAPGAFDISQATKVGWKGGAIAVPGSARVKKWRVLPGAGELLAHLKERGLKQGLFSSASDSDRQETLEQLRNFKFSPVEEVTTKEAATGAASISPETFRRVCDQWGLPPKQVLVADISCHAVNSKHWEVHRFLVQDASGQPITSLQRRHLIAKVVRSTLVG